ncbi:MAG: hypothetical protein PHX51_04250 [Clostridia bacterium]|nr:hypothetical protein [Clostridia bacterium]
MNKKTKTILFSCIGVVVVAAVVVTLVLTLGGGSDELKPIDTSTMYDDAVFESAATQEETTALFDAATQRGTLADGTVEEALTWDLYEMKFSFNTYMTGGYLKVSGDIIANNVDSLSESLMTMESSSEYVYGSISGGKTASSAYLKDGYFYTDILGAKTKVEFTQEYLNSLMPDNRNDMVETLGELLSDYKNLEENGMVVSIDTTGDLIRVKIDFGAAFFIDADSEVDNVVVNKACMMMVFDKSYNLYGIKYDCDIVVDGITAVFNMELDRYFGEITFPDLSQWDV